MKIYNRSNLLKLIDFLKVLDESSFDFSKIAVANEPEPHCGSVCCAMGWTPRVFPDLIEWCNLRKLYGGKTTLDVQSKGGRYFSYDEVAQFLFGDLFTNNEWSDIFSPFGRIGLSYIKGSIKTFPDSDENFTILPYVGEDATPKQVAQSLVFLDNAIMDDHRNNLIKIQIK